MLYFPFHTMNYLLHQICFLFYLPFFHFCTVNFLSKKNHKNFEPFKSFHSFFCYIAIDNNDSNYLKNRNGSKGTYIEYRRRTF